MPKMSRSRSSSSSSSSSTSRDTSSTSSPKSRRLTSSTNANHQPIVHSDDRRPLAICVKNLPLRSSDTSLKDGLFHEYKKHGKVTWVKVVGQNSERHAIVCFKKPEDVEKALEVSYDKLFFGCKIEVAPYQGYDVEDNDLRPYEAEIDEFHPKATRTLFIGNLEKDVTASDLRKHFDQFGEIIEIDIKKQGAVSSYAFCQYSDIVSVVKAIRKMDGEHLGNNRIKLGFGKSMPYTCVWIDGVNENVNEKYLRMQFEPFGVISKAAVNKMRGFSLKNTKIQVDFASRECQESFFERLEKQGTVLDRSVFDERRDSTARSFDSTTVTRFSSYDEYSQGSAASHEDAYEHEYVFAHDSPTHIVDPLDTRSIQSVVDTVVPFAPPDIRNLQKERVHLLEQLEECPSSGDEIMSPKKRLKLELLDSTITSDVIIEANRDHRKVMEGKHSTRDIAHDRSGYLPHAVCKRRKTAGSDSGSRVHHYDHSGSESVGGSRPGTPLCDERPENFQPSEPRRVPREREGPLTLPLPRFAAQVMNRGNVSVAGIKGQKDNVLSSPPPAVTSPRISNPRPPSPVHVPPPASPPPRPPSLSSNSSDSDITPPSPSLEERIKSLDEKYEKWSGSRALSAAGGDALAMLDANLEKFRLRHKLLDLDLKEVQPSEIVKSVMAKRSVFDEDLKRLENVGEKYEPKEFRTGIPAAKGLQYPFPTHPPVLMSPAPSHPQTPPTPTTSTPLIAPTATSTTTRGTSHGENRLKPCASVSSDIRTSSKVNVNRCTVVSSLAPIKTSEKTNVNIPNTGDFSATPSASLTSEKHNKSVREIKSSDKTSEKISCRRDSNSSSPRADIKTRRNSDTSARRIEDSEKFNDTENNHKERAKSEERKKERLEKARLENEKLEKEKAEKERIEKERLEKEKQEKERLEKERLEKERLERESELEKQRLEKERLEKERIEKEKQEKERTEKEKARLEKERAEKVRQEKERLEKERLEREKIEKENLEKERQERERLEKEKREREKREREEHERKEKEEKERREQQEKERLEKLEKDRKERERERELKEREERERREREDQEKREREERERKEKEEKERRIDEERLEKERLEREKHDKERKREDERARHKDDNHDKRKDDHKHRENHSETKHRENCLDKHLFDNKNTKDSSKEEKSIRDTHELFRRDSHDSRSSHEKTRHHIERDAERRKESIKENRDNNIHDKHKNFNDVKDSNIRAIIESRHMSIELDKNRTYDNIKQDPNRRKERNNSLPAGIGSKRRISSHENMDSTDENKRIKFIHDHKKLPERRDSKDSTRSEEKSSKIQKNLMKNEKKGKKSERSATKKHKLEKQKSKSKSREKESRDSPSTPKSPLTDKDFLARLDLRSNEEIEKQRKDNKDYREKDKRKEILTGGISEEKEIKDRSFEDRIKREKQSIERQQNHEKTPKIRSDAETTPKSSDERKKRDRIRKITNSSDSENSDEPKKHSIFDIVDDEPAYISMYDKVKARSCKNMAKQEEEKRQEKIKAKFSQLKQSRAKREEKKRSTSWDEDSESDKDPSEMKIKRWPKMLIDSSDDESQERKSRKKKDIYSDSDSSAILRQIKREQLDTSDDEIKNKNILFKSCKSRITSDTSEDEYNKKKLQSQIKTELFSDTETTNIQGFVETDEKPQLTKVKDALERLIKKERRNSKHQDSLNVEINAEMFEESSSPLLEPKTEKLNNINSFAENSSDEEPTQEETGKKEKSERKEKKHKKKQKKQKHSLTSEEAYHSKKEKRRDKTKEGREKSKKSKKNKCEIKPEPKREGKMENIFGSLSEDSENGKHLLEQKEQQSGTCLDKIIEGEELQQSAYNSESEKEQTDNKAKEKEEREREREEHKRRKEKKRRDKERRLQEVALAAIEQTSMDYADMGKQLEANMLKDESLDASEEVTKSEVESSNLENTDDPFHFSEVNELQEVKREKEDRKEGKEKKKKRKKSKDERSKHHHHHHHHDKNKTKSTEFSEFKKDVSPTKEIKIEIEEPKPQDQSLPTILDEHNSPSNKVRTPDFSISPSTRETNPLISPIPKTPTTSKEKKRDKFIPGFVVKKEEIISEEENKTDKSQSLSEEKPRVIISQEETEDAVAALLGESFGNGQFEECYNEEISSNNDQTTTLAKESNVQDDEEMRQAVQSLSATDLDVKPDTPQSEHELQIDTDTEEQEEISLRFDSKTSDLSDFSSQPAKTPDIPSYFHKDENTAIVSSSLVLKTTSNIGSPPSLTPIKPQPAAVAEIRKSLDLEQKNTSEISVNKTDTSVIKIETRKLPRPVSETIQQSQPKTITPTLRQYSPPVVKIAESAAFSALKTSTKPEHVKLSPDQSTKIQPMPLLQTAKSPTTAQLHNLPARSPVQINKPQNMHDLGILSPKSAPNLIHNRLPITPVMVSKPLQATTVILQQSKVAQSLEPPKLVSTADYRQPQERPRMVFQTSAVQPPQFSNFPPNQPRMMIQGNVRHLLPQGLLVPTRQLPPNNYGYLGNIPHSTYSLSSVVKDNPAALIEKNQKESAIIMSNSTPSGLDLVSSQNSAIQPNIISPSNNQPHLAMSQPLVATREHSPKLNTSTLASPKVITSTPSTKPFITASLSPKPSPVAVNASSPKPVMPVSSPKLVTPATSPKPIISVSNPCPKPTIIATTFPISSTAEMHPVPSICQTGPKTVEVTPKVPSTENLDPIQLNVITEIKTSTPSPVIVPVSKESIIQELKVFAPMESKPEEPPAKLAIEKVTEELNMSLEKESPEVKEEKEPTFEEKTDTQTDAPAEEPIENKPEIKDEVKQEVVAEKPSVDPENSSVIKEIEKFDDERAETESVISDISKERSSADILTKDDPLDTKEDSDYWSANIDSVIKALCSADELSDHSSENGKDEWFDDNKANEPTKPESIEKEPSTPDKRAEEPVVETKSDESEIHDEGVEPEEEPKEMITLRSGSRSRSGRGRGRGKARGNSIDRSGIQTRRGKLNKETPVPIVSPTKRGRGGRPRNDRKLYKSELEAAPADIYEFRDEFDDTNKEQRPRLILTIKSPAISSASNSSQTTAIVKEVTKDGAKEIGKEHVKEVVTHPQLPIQGNLGVYKKKDTSRNTVDDTIEDVVKNTIQTRAATNQRRSTRQVAPKQQPPIQPETLRKSPRGRKPRRGSEAMETSSSEDTPKEECKPVPAPPKVPETPKEMDKEIQKESESLKEKPHESLKAAMLRRIKGELTNTSQHESTNLIDPVTGELIPMRECEEGKYIPLPGSASKDQRLVITNTKGTNLQIKQQDSGKAQQSVIAQPQQATIVQQAKPQSFKAHVLSSQAAQAVVTQQPSTTPVKSPTVQQASLQSQPAVKNTAPILVTKMPVAVAKTVTQVVVTKTTTPVVISKPVTPISQHLSINTSLSMNVASTTHLSPRPNVPLTVTSKPMPKQLVKPPVLSPVLALANQQKQMLQVSKPQSQQISKGHMVTPMITSQAQMVNTQMAHMKHQSAMKQQVIMGKGPLAKSAHSLHQQQILTGAVPSPPLGKSQSPLNNPSRIIQGPPPLGAKGVMEPPKVDVSIPNVMLGQRPKLSPQGPQQRLVSQTGMPVPGYEASLGEAIAHFPPGPLRPPPDLNPAHYMHPSHVMQYQQYLRQQLQHIRSGGIEKVGDGQEGEEAPVTSPPLELRRPGSVGLALTGRGAAVPHSLHSPHDRATDSPQVGQVYNVHSARMQHYHSNRYYDQTEPPPAHRPLTSHSSLAALGSDRGLAHMTPLGTPERPLSGHSTLSAHMGGLSTPDRSMPSHVERPISTHGLMGAGLGAGGNLMGAVARHIGADTPTSQRGLQAATPPHASQVPPQAESLFMLLKVIQYPCMWQGLLALKNDQAAVQMYFVSGNDDVAKCSLPKNIDGSTPPLRIFQRMRLEPPQVEGVARKMQMENEHCMLLALPCGHDHMDVLKQSTNLSNGFITYLQLKQAAGIVNVAAPGTSQPPAYVVHIFPSCDFVNENLRRIAPSLLERVADIAHLLIVITTV
ncbi:hypothetical protein NQ314_003381 [Rhamnusium bicolor]|uniref:Msx2-interacting protein n=1 Tax=Rhamnusium bicolor TaxID=1586634 RepID=A0AAV8ZP32_9CUCU|nr:hypothetical protein NQ314_003381 [Rhamnusium bicolor]